MRHPPGPPTGDAVVDDPGFAHGDCQDTAFGTLLRLAGVAHPEDLLLGDLAFEVGVDRGVADGLSPAYRTGGPLPPATGPTGTGIGLVEHRAADLPHLHRHLRDRTRGGRAVAVTVDQYGYEPAPFHLRAHVPHHLVVTAASGDDVEVLDSFPRSRFSGRVAPDRFARWADSPHLGAARYRTVELTVAPGATDAVTGWLAATWRDQVRRNVAAMLDPAGRHGVAAIGLVADRLAEWLAGPDFRADPGRRRELPVSSFTDLGALRRGHALWLSRVAALGHPALAECADRLRAVSRQWDVAASLWLAGGPAPVTDPAAADLVARGLYQVPKLVRLIAAAERRVVEQLDAAVRQG
ncbi:hypothetical protein AWW66_09025 [Micromonospora rosaria]|uniref:Butirosin biosynthesis protein H N-terminal domain-containing protein n=1 Tax=Micromonospora rosaria TaxID=47874 RepID=A0A136PVF9_9ACTN|nr:hypothetical protein [Micromonospora rosaria]KXK62274.1 hypothetical protein AWW66_09025 [Micromonospora rosaria]